MNRNEYNGWTNYETWVLKLWIDNEEGWQRYWQEQTASVLAAALASPPFTQLERAQLTLADALREDFEEAEAELLKRAGCSASVWADLLNAALSEVNWHEIACSFIDNALDRQRLTADTT